MSKNTWFKVATNMITDPKMKRLTDAEWGKWIKLLCLMSQQRQYKPYLMVCASLPYDFSSLAKDLGGDKKVWEKFLEKIEALDMISRGDFGEILVKNWEKWQRRYFGDPEIIEDSGEDLHRQIQSKNIDTDIEIDIITTPPTPPSPAESEEVVPEKPKKIQKRAAVKVDYSKEFIQFWMYYPRPMNKKQTWECWNKRISEGFAPGDMIVGAKEYALKTQGTEDRFIKHSTTFLGPECHFKEWADKNKQKQEAEDEQFRTNWGGNRANEGEEPF